MLSVVLICTMLHVEGILVKSSICRVLCPLHALPAIIQIAKLTAGNRVELGRFR